MASSKAKSAKVDQSATDTHVVTTSSGSVHISQPAGSSKRAPKVTVLVAPDDLVRNQVGGFVNFLREHAVVGLAVGFIIGQQAQTVIKSLVDSFITPTLSLIIGQDLLKKKFTVSNSSGHIYYTWGSFVYGLVNFIFVLLAVYVIIKLLKLDKLDQPKS